MAQQLERQEAVAMIRAKLVELIRLAMQHDINIEALMHEALDFCDPKPP